MPEFSETPPPLHFSPSLSDHDRTSTRESTPIGTPRPFPLSVSRKPERDRDLHFSWHHKPAGRDSLRPDSTAGDSNDFSTFPLFPSSPPERAMESNAAPLDISPRPTNVSSSGQQASNLTSALQRASGSGGFDSNNNWNAAGSAALKANAGRKDSIGASMSQWGNGSKPIMVTGANRDKQRRESLAGSLAGGMSWGGVSAGSWIRDDIIMTGTSPFTLQSPSYHSSSYLPKLEANFMRDFSCCGITLPSLHDLLQHYEEAHAQKSPQPQQRQPVQNTDNRGGVPQSQQGLPPTGGMGGGPSPRPDSAQAKASPAPSQQGMRPQNGFGMSQMNDFHDLDTVDDMEMDDPLTDTTYPQSGTQGTIQARFAQENQGGRVTPLNLSLLQGQAFRSSQPSTPVAQTRPLQNNPTVSSVNTPTLMSHPQQQYRSTPDSSGPGTPAELDDSVVGGLSNMSMQNNTLMGGQSQFSGYGSNDMVELCIDEPAKRLFRPSGNFKNTPTNTQFRLSGAQYGPNSEIARRIREQQRLAGVPDLTVGLHPNEEPKPYRCPVIGCEKAYKNQNGLKYHKSHGHNNQQLHDNADGTFSIVNPETSTPYPGTLGMEKEKPYRCEICGKRYKNLNGLKYHRAHSPPCNPELGLAASRGIGTGGVMQGENINVAGAGLPGIGE